MNITVEIKRSERFEVAFNQVHDSLKQMAKNEHTDKFTHLLRSSNHHKIIQVFQDDLLQYAKLRNALVHEKKAAGYYIAEPHEEVVIRLERIADLLAKPNYALSIATKDVVYFDSTETVENVIRKVRTSPYSQYPVYKDKNCVGLLTTRGIVNWMSANITKCIVDFSDIKINEVLQYEQEHPLTFAPKSIDILEIEDLYKERHQKKQDLEMVIITENGEQHESPLGIVTAWDLIAIDYAVDF